MSTNDQESVDDASKFFHAILANSLIFRTTNCHKCIHEKLKSSLLTFWTP